MFRRKQNVRVQELTGKRSDQQLTLIRLNGHHLLVSTINIPLPHGESQRETFAFLADKHGNILSFTEVWRTVWQGNPAHDMAVEGLLMNGLE